MDSRPQQYRDLSSNTFGDHATIHQGDVHNHSHTHQPLPAPAQPALRIIPYPRNEEVVRRPELVDALNALLSEILKFSSAALWGLGGSGQVLCSPLVY